jgi:hypothetical protein
VVPAAASSTLREPAQTLRCPAGALCGCTGESPSAWNPSRLPLGTLARHWQSNFLTIPPNLISRSPLRLRSALPRWTTSTLPPRSPSPPAPDSTPYSATLPTNAPDPTGRSNSDPARRGRSTDERVPIDRIAPMCMPQGQCQAASIVRSDDQMHVIRHQAITNQPQPMEFNVLA